MNQTIHPEHTTLRGGIKWVAIAGWIVLVVLLIGTFVIGVPLRWDYLQGKTPSLPVSGLSPYLEGVAASRLGLQELRALDTLGASPEFYASYILFFEVALALVCIITGLVIFVRRSDDWMALLFSLSIILLGTNSVAFVVPSLALIAIRWVLVSSIAQMLGMTANLYLLFLSPDGWFVPRWTQVLVVGFTGLILGVGLYLLATFESAIAYVLLLFLLLFWFPLIGLGIWSQIHRYRHVSGPVQRQQTKWIVVGLAAITLGFVVNGIFNYVSFYQTGLPRLLSNLARASLTHLFMMVLPICVAFSILRYRLWDIDVIIRRTVTYAAVTALLVFVFFSSVILLQQLFASFTSSGQNDLVTVLSTLAIAALFVPLRNRIQNLIDRRFNRKKYEAQKVIEHFSHTVRDETDLEKLTGELVNVVQETMQPKSVSVWLNRGVRRQGNR